MFYVSGISGSLTPFDPQSTPFATPIQPLGPVASVPDTAKGVAAIPGNAATSQPVSDDAAVYEGSVIPTTQELTKLGDASILGRTAASMAYRIHEAEYDSEAPPPETIARIGASESIDINKANRYKVLPIKRFPYQRENQNKNRKQAVLAKDIMSSPVFCLKEDVSIGEVQKILNDHQFRHIPIFSNANKLVGLVSDRDFIGAFPGQSSRLIPINERMITNILTARPETPIRDIADVMTRHHIGCLPILDAHGTLVGIITRSDILLAIVRHAPIELWT